MTGQTITQPADQMTDQEVTDWARMQRQAMQDGTVRWNDFLDSVGARAMKGQTLSEAQMGALRKFIDREREFQARKTAQQAEDALAADVPTGPMTIEGVIIGAKWRTGGPYEPKIAITVKDDRGFRVWGNAPAKVSRAMDDDPDRLKGVRVRFTATISPSEDDPKFGFFKQPRDAEVLAVNAAPSVAAESVAAAAARQQEKAEFATREAEQERAANERKEADRQARYEENERALGVQGEGDENRPAVDKDEAVRQAVLAISFEGAGEIAKVMLAIMNGNAVTILTDGILDDENISDSDKTVLVQLARTLGRARDAEVA